MKFRRTKILIAATVGAALALSLVGAGAAQASNASDASYVLAAINKYRVAHSVPALNPNGFMGDYMQNIATIYATKGEKAAEDEMSDGDLPGHCSSWSWKYSTGHGSSAKTQIAKQITGNALALSSHNYGAVGYATKGSTAYVVYVLVTCLAPQLGKLTVDSVAVAGTPKVGVPLIAKIGGYQFDNQTVQNPPAVDVAYRWTAESASGVSKDVGLNSPTFTPTPSEAGDRITVSITATAIGYSSTTAASAHSPVVAPGTLPSPKSVVVTGHRNVGEWLTVSLDGWVSGSLIPALSVQWYRDGHTIPGETGPLYQAVAADYGHKITAGITSAADGYATVHKVSTTSAKIGYPFLVQAGGVHVTGGMTYGSFVAAAVGLWSPTARPITYTYQWYEGGKKVSGATHSTHKLGVAAATSGAVTVAVTAHESHFAATTVMSPVNSVKKAILTNLSGISFRVGQIIPGAVVTARSAVWTPAPSKVSYQWMRNGVAIPGATKSSFTLSAADSGEVLGLKETASKSGYDPATIIDNLTVPNFP
jgi:hypothetical protein